MDRVIDNEVDIDPEDELFDDDEMIDIDDDDYLFYDDDEDIDRLIVEVFGTGAPRRDKAYAEALRKRAAEVYFQREMKRIDEEYS